MQMVDIVLINGDSERQTVEFLHHGWCIQADHDRELDHLRCFFPGRGVDGLTGWVAGGCVTYILDFLFY